MLEIILLYTLAKRVGAIVRKKGYTAFWYQFLLVVFWFGGEFGGFFLGGFIGIILGDGKEPAFLLVYLFGLLGAILGAVTTFYIAKSLTPAFPEPFAVRDESAAQEYFGERQPYATGGTPDQIQRPHDESYRS